MQSVKFKEEHITVASLAAALQKPTVLKMIEELLENKERGIYTENLASASILPWGVVTRACERAGLEALDEWMPEVNEPLTRKEIEIIQKAAKEAAVFHRDYGEYLKKYTVAVDKEASEELYNFHINYANEIETLVGKLEIKKRPLEAPKIGDM